jgi:hypothetical protein
MAKIMADLALHISANSAELKTGIDQAKSKLRDLKDGFKDLGESTNKVMESIAGAVGGVAEDLSNFAGSIMTATGPIGVLVAVIGGIAMAWKKSREEVEAYLKSADKGMYGAAAFMSESKDAMKDTEKRVRGGISEGGHLQQLAREGLLATDLTEEQKKQLNIMMETGKQMVKQNAELFQTLGLANDNNSLLKDGYDWKKRYSDLLLKQEELDERAISNGAEITDLQAHLFDIKTKMMQTTDPVEKQKLQVEYEKTANGIYEKRMSIINETRSVTGEILKMTGKDEDAKLLGLHLDADAAEAGKEKERALSKAEMLQLKINKLQEKAVDIAARELKELKEKNSLFEGGETGTKLGTKYYDKDSNLQTSGEVNTGGLMKSLKKSGIGSTSGIKAADKELKAYNGTLASTLALNIKYAEVQERVNNAFNDFASSVSQGADSFKDFARNVVSSMKHVIAALLSATIANAIEKSVAFAKNPIIGVALGAVMGGLAATLFNSLVPGFANGTNFAPGGLSLVGERGPELVNLPRGSQVFTNSQSQGMMGGRIKVDFVHGALQGYMDYSNRQVKSYK